jgi:hypothetical protein
MRTGLRELSPVAAGFCFLRPGWRVQPDVPRDCHCESAASRAGKLSGIRLIIRAGLLSHPRRHWSIYGINLRGPLPERLVVQGLPDDLEAAKAAFKANWQKLLAAGTAQP